ncbi:MAG: hypothetical protein CM15mP111_2200 [Hyphomicrobiales bacterium]|nr:MAG: hypothetical protein CM15mP111_2200 [Hyphomicrobiales bacterium]
MDIINVGIKIFLNLINKNSILYILKERKHSGFCCGTISDRDCDIIDGIDIKSRKRFLIIF